MMSAVTLGRMQTALIKCPRYKNSATWKAKVLKMPEEQVIAIFVDFKKRGLIR